MENSESSLHTVNLFFTSADCSSGPPAEAPPALAWLSMGERCVTNLFVLPSKTVRVETSSFVQETTTTGGVLVAAGMPELSSPWAPAPRSSNAGSSRGPPAAAPAP